MGFVIDKQGNYLPVFGEAQGGGGGGTSNHSQLSNLDYATAGHTGFMPSADFIADGTTYTVKADGTADYTTLTDAVNDLYSKWCNGTVNIEIDGSITDTAGIAVNSDKNYNIPVLRISGKNSATITYNSTSTPFFEIHNARVIISDVSFVNSAGESSKLYTALKAWRGSILTLSNVSISGGFIIARQLGQIEILGNLTINNNLVAIYAQVGGFIVSDATGTITSNCSWLLQGWQGGYIAIPDGKSLSFTGSNLSLTPNGTADSNGYTRYPSAWDNQ